MIRSITKRMRRALAIMPALALLLLFPRVAQAGTDPVAAMLAQVLPAVVRVTSVRPQTPPTDSTGGKVTTAAADLGTYTAFGSGYIIDPSGYIGTNKHVIDGAMEVYVMTADGVRYPARVVGMTAPADMALLKIDAGNKALPYVKFGDVDKMHVGDQVVAVGSPFGFDDTVTSGIISALNRNIMESPFDDYIQTDAAINHGNSGGPLFNMSGEVIGMNSVIFSPDPSSAGIGFAIPSSSLKFVYDRLMNTGKINGGMLPIHTQELTWMLQQALGTPDLLGALVTSVQDPHGTKLEGNIQPGDVIRMFNGETVLDPRDLARKAAHSSIGSDAALAITRHGTLETVHVTLQAIPEGIPPVLDNDGPRALGLELASVQQDSGDRVVRVDAVDPSGTAASSGIQKGDLILEVQQTPVSEPGQALRAFWAQSSLKQKFAAVLVKHQKTIAWMSLAIPE